LHEILLAAAQKAGVEVRCGLAASEIHDDNDGVTVDFSNGQTGAFDLLAGFDGIRSPAAPPRRHGVRAASLGLRRVAPASASARLRAGNGVPPGDRQQGGAMPLADDLMYLFHIRPEARDAVFERRDYPDLLRERLRNMAATSPRSARRSMQARTSSTADRAMMLPWPWFAVGFAIGGDARMSFLRT